MRVLKNYFITATWVSTDVRACVCVWINVCMCMCLCNVYCCVFMHLSNTFSFDIFSLMFYFSNMNNYTHSYYTLITVHRFLFNHYFFTFIFLGSTLISFLLAIFSGEFFEGISFLLLNSDVTTWLSFIAFCSFGYCGANFGAALTHQVLLYCYC